MMPPGKLMRIVVQNTVRSPKHFALSAFGIVIGIAAFVFFLGLSAGVQKVVIGEIFPVDQIEVVAPRVSMLSPGQQVRIDNAVVEQIRARPEVAAAVPRMSLAFPASGQAWFQGRALNVEVGGFADGIAASAVVDESFAELFQDWEASVPPAERKPCGPPPAYVCADPGRYYCDRRDRTCHHRVPILISPTLVELYNNQFAGSHGLPVIDDRMAQLFLGLFGRDKLRLYIHLGDTIVAGTNARIDRNKRRRVEGMLVGISARAIPIGMTVPIGYVTRWNREFVGEEAASSYSSVVVTANDPDDVAPFAAWVQDQIGLRLEDSLGERFAMAIFIVTALFVLISVVIVSISAINITHNLFMQISERRREIGLLRAVGATRADIGVIVLGEAAFIGLAGGALGVALAMGAAWAVDAAAAAWLPSFPFKPETYFGFQGSLIGGGLGFSVVFCVLGGILPARKAVRVPPAQALVQQ